jgi:hypothetical protein
MQRTDPHYLALDREWTTLYPVHYLPGVQLDARVARGSVRAEGTPRWAACRNHEQVFGGTGVCS